MKVRRSFKKITKLLNLARQKLTLRGYILRSWKIILIVFAILNLIVISINFYIIFRISNENLISSSPSNMNQLKAADEKNIREVIKYIEAKEYKRESLDDDLILIDPSL